MERDVKSAWIRPAAPNGWKGAGQFQKDCRPLLWPRVSARAEPACRCGKAAEDSGGHSVVHRQHHLQNRKVPQPEPVGAQ
jgi:hypothetical protein